MFYRVSQEVMASLCITAARAFHSCCTSSDTSHQGRNQIRRAFRGKSETSKCSTHLCSLHNELEKPSPPKRQQQALLLLQVTCAWGGNSGRAAQPSVSLQSRPSQDRPTEAAVQSLLYHSAPLSCWMPPGAEGFLNHLNHLSMELSDGHGKAKTHTWLSLFFLFLLDPN